MAPTVASDSSKALALGIFILLLSFARCRFTDDDDEETDLGEAVQYVDGDILIVVFAPITTHDNDMKCIRKFGHATMAEQVNMFLEKVNNDDTTLPGIKLGAIVINSCHSVNHSLRKLFMDVLMPYVLGMNCTKPFCQNGKRILAGVVGATRSGVSMGISNFLQVFEISQVSYWSTSTDLSDKTRYKYFFRTVPSDSVQAEAMADFIEQMGWNYVSVVYTNNMYGIKGFQEISSRLSMKNLCVAVSHPINETTNEEEVKSVLKILLEHDKAKAVILFATRSVAVEVLSVASKQSDTKEISWIASDGWTANLFTLDKSYLDAVHGTIGFSLKFPDNDRLNERVRSLTLQDYRGENTTLNPWWQDYLKHIKNCTTKEGTGKRLCGEYERIPGYKASRNALDDTLEVFQHALHEYHRITCRSARGLCYEMAKTAGTGDIAKALYGYMRNVTFLTSERRVFRFDDKQDGPPLYNILAFDKSRVSPDGVVDDGWYTVGTYDNIAKINITNDLPEAVKKVESVCSKECEAGYAKILAAEICCWVCQKCGPRDYVSQNSCIACDSQEMPNSNGSACIPIPIEEMHYDSGYSIACLAFGMFGLVCTMAVTAMYWKHRDTAIVRASGRELCFLVLAGVAFTLLNCFVVTAPPSEVSCGLTRLILALGPAVIYAGLLMKTFRVVFIFQSKGILSIRTKGYLEPGPLIFLTLCVVMIQAIIVIIWMVLSPPTVFVYYAEDVAEAFRTCKNIVDERVYVGLAYPFLIIIICTILATVNRNVPTGFRETLFVGFTMYTTCVTWIAFQVLFFTNVDEQRVQRQLTTLSCALSISAITVLLCLFGPRCYTILRHPELNTSEVVMSRHSRNGNGHCNLDRAPPNDQIGSVSAGVINKAFSNISNGDVEIL